MTTGNAEMELARQYVELTRRSVFLTGRAGTGKTTFLRQLKEARPKRMVVVAPTGVAAINAKGVTIHSFFQIAPGLKIPGASSTVERRKTAYRMSEQKKNIMRTLDLLVIDEISMVRCDLLDAVDEVLRQYRDRTKPFGGVQLLLIGDLQQLAPVAKDDEWALLKDYYETPYFFSSHALRQVELTTIELKKIYRQADEEFINILAQIRTNTLTTATVSKLNSRYVEGFVAPADEEWIRLTTHNAAANAYNSRMLEDLAGASVAPHIALETSSKEILKQFAANGLGVAFMPDMAARAEADRGLLTRLGWAGNPFPVFSRLYIHRDKHVSPAIQGLADLIRQAE